MIKTTNENVFTDTKLFSNLVLLKNLIIKTKRISSVITHIKHLQL